jgi:hypothetical protein
MSLGMKKFVLKGETVRTLTSTILTACVRTKGLAGAQ